MQKMIRILSYLILGTFAWVLIFVKANDVKDQADFSYKLKSRVLGPCSVPLYYSLGSFDNRFDLSQEEFLNVVERAENVWENEIGKNLFAYKEDSEFKINLIFDERQLGTLERKKLERQFENVGSLQKNIETEYNSLLSEYTKKNKAYEKNIKNYEKDLDKYKDQVDYWNDQGGAPEGEYKNLQLEKEKLEKQAAELEKQQKELNSLVKKINSLVKQGNNIAKNYNNEVETFKERFGDSREFDQGLYTGKEINIYQFSELTDLELVVAHELGHYLGVAHTQDPRSIMYYLMGEQDLNNIKATQEDLAAVKNICK